MKLICKKCRTFTKHLACDCKPGCKAMICRSCKTSRTVSQIELDKMSGRGGRPVLRHDKWER